MGFFDGVHKGHQSLIDLVLQRAKEHRLSSAVLTFWPHPRLVLNKDPEKLRFLTTLNEKSKIIAKQKIDYFIIQEFTLQFYRFEPEEFISRLVTDYNLKHLVVGADHRFGKEGKGNPTLLKKLASKYGFGLDVVAQQSVGSLDISSTKIRAALLNGKLELANQMLGYTYLLTGSVESGNKIGRQLGFPTANIRPNDPLKLLPKEGVYAVIIQIEGCIKHGMLNIGFRPTVNTSRRQTIEVNIFDFERNIYHTGIEVAFIKRLRNEKRFPSLSELKEQLESDKDNALRAIREHSKEGIKNLFLTLQKSVSN